MTNIGEMVLNENTLFLSEQLSDKVVEKISKHHPSDHIYLSHEEDIFLMDLWEGNVNGKISIPSDIFFAKTIPLKDCIITVDESDLENNIVTVNYRVIIFDDYESVVDGLKGRKTEVGIVGAIVPIFSGFNTSPIAFSIFVVPGSNSITAKVVFLKKDFAEKAKTLNYQFYADYFISLMESWYGIQIALLHPAVKDVFKHPKITKEVSEERNTSKSKKHRKAKYIRKHYLTIEKLEEVSKSKEARKINRKCLSWYVIGHWRTYKNGKKVFVMPYWKGVLRDVKKNSDGDMREREINIEWDAKENGTMIFPQV